MTDCVLYTRRDGSVVILHPNAHTGLPGEKPEDALARIIHHSVPNDALKVLVVDSHNLPTDYTFNEAWELDGAHIVTNMAKARDLHRRTLRAARAPRLRKLDIEYQRADEDGDTERKQAIVAKKRQLRDVTLHPDIDAAQTPEELARVWPFDDAYDAPQTILRKEPALLQRSPEPAWSMSELLQRAANEPHVGALADPEAPEAPPAPAPILIEPEPPLPITVPSPPPPPVDDSARRRAAKARVRAAALSFAFTEDDRVLYEQALMAHNGNVEAMETISPLARAAGVTVQQMAERIVNAHTVKARRMLHVKAVLDRALAEIDAATGEDIGRLEQIAAAQINGETNAAPDR